VNKIVKKKMEKIGEKLKIIIIYLEDKEEKNIK
jgi:hypothetical protein